MSLAAVIKVAAIVISICILLCVLAASSRTVLEIRFPFVRKFEEGTRQAYLVLAVIGAMLLFFGVVDYSRIKSIDVFGVRAELNDLKERVNLLSEQVEEFYRSKRIEVFDTHNWDRVRVVEKSAEGVTLEVTLERPPIPGSIEVFEGVLLMPETEYRVEGRRLRFPANGDKPINPLTIKYHPRVETSINKTQH